MIEDELKATKRQAAQRERAGMDELQSLRLALADHAGALAHSCTLEYAESRHSVSVRKDRLKRAKPKRLWTVEGHMPCEHHRSPAMPAPCRQTTMCGALDSMGKTHLARSILRMPCTHDMLPHSRAGRLAVETASKTALLSTSTASGRIDSLQQVESTVESPLSQPV